jgi:glutamine amidotransferase
MIKQSYRHPDGTGLAHYVGHRPILEKHPIAAHRDRKFVTEARQVRSHLFVAHVRHATQGRPCLHNTQPFTDNSLVFAHNGNIYGLENLPLSLGPFDGDTDSERYFALLCHHIREAPDMLSAIRKAIRQILENCTYTSLNFILSDGDYIYAFRLPETEDLYVRRLAIEEDFRGLSSYGTRMECSERCRAILFASEEIDLATSWSKLEPGTIAVARPDLHLEFHHI